MDVVIFIQTVTKISVLKAKRQIRPCKNMPVILQKVSELVKIFI